ncbi:MAG: Wzz/FepE/Etk N-terminal domain-containing protein [Desulfobacteraceae bacterium]|jgi:polysaccharide chain length determinant protein (PEP-CTERM system associated)
MEENQKQSMEEESTLSISDYMDILKRRKWSLILPAMLVSAVAVILAYVLPPTYKSTATIMIEEQQIPDEYVKTTVTSYAEQRIQQIHRRIISTGKLLEIINRFNLYKNLRNERSTDSIVQQMRNNISIESISAEVMDRNSGRSKEITIAFSLTFQSQDLPLMVQQVTDTLANLFLEENLQVRAKQTQETARFLEDELNKVKASLDVQEAKIARFKEENINTLPELLQVNLQSLNNTERSIDMMQEQLRSLKEREGYLQSQLTNISPSLEEQRKDQQHLEDLKVLLLNLKSRFTDEYPDVIKTEAEIAKLEKQLATKEDISSIESMNAENPAYITLAAQLSSTQADIETLNKQITNLKNKAENYRKLIEKTPRVEENYTNLTIKRNNTRAKYDDLMQKLLEVQVSQGLETEQKGERFTLMEPARLPGKPFKPNRLGIIMIGIILGICSGLGMAILKEFIDDSIHSPDYLSRATSFPVLATIPDIIPPKKSPYKKQKIFMLTGGTLVMAIIVGILFFHSR